LADIDGLAEQRASPLGHVAKLFQQGSELTVRAEKLTRACSSVTRSGAARNSAMPIASAVQFVPEIQP